MQAGRLKKTVGSLMRVSVKQNSFKQIQNRSCFFGGVKCS